jgi:SPP1 family phage portal protein
MVDLTSIASDSGIDLSAELSPEAIGILISQTYADRLEYLRLYNAYKGEGLPIQSRTFTDTSKINSQLANDFRGEIVDQLVGYLFGKPITYSLDGEDQRQQDYFQTFLSRVDIDDIDSETAKISGACGVAYRLLYIDADGIEQVEIVYPWEVLVCSDVQTIRHYDALVGSTLKHVAFVYTDSSISRYESVYGSSVFGLVETTPHYFGGVPIVEFRNNDEYQSDFGKVETLIDAYDRAVSDAQNEIEEFRNAYMIFTGGGTLEPEVLEAARQAGAFSLPEGCGATFLTKAVNGDFLESHKSTLKSNIYRFSKTVDMSDESFSGSTMSGEARKWKLLGLESRAGTRERKFTAALREQFQLLTNVWSTRGVTIPPDTITYQFDRNIPIELSSEAETTGKLKGMVTEQTRLSLLSFVDDPKQEQADMESEAVVNLDAITPPLP